ncbi:MAG: ribonuclease H-like domain-containing protein [Candidatus Omnitrophica bacterium]|nr:ribonuclease H-like domain-containing protein [Candidatus Omnitrophota bacterium]
MSNILVLDLETQRSFKEVGKQNLHKLRISVVGTYDYLTQDYSIYEEKDILQLDKRIREAELLIGFNIRRFDLPVLAPYLFTPIENLPVLDLIDAVEKHRGHRASLDSIAQPTLKLSKSGTGFDALTLFQDGRIEELKRYCLDDVRLTKEVYNYGMANGKIYFTSSWDYKTYEIPVSWREETEEFLRSVKPSSAEFPTSLF